MLEMSRCGRRREDARLRQIVAVPHDLDSPGRLVYEWSGATGQFTVVDNWRGQQGKTNWTMLEAVLRQQHKPATHHELLADWPVNAMKPSPSALYDWLNRAVREKRVRRSGSGTRNDPWRYWLEGEVARRDAAPRIGRVG